jgi:hypothetical protein
MKWQSITATRIHNTLTCAAQFHAHLKALHGFRSTYFHTQLEFLQLMNSIEKPE